MLLLSWWLWANWLLIFWACLHASVFCSCRLYAAVAVNIALSWCPACYHILLSTVFFFFPLPLCTDKEGFGSSLAPVSIPDDGKYTAGLLFWLGWNILVSVSHGFLRPVNMHSFQSSLYSVHRNIIEWAAVPCSSVMVGTTSTLVTYLLTLRFGIQWLSLSLPIELLAICWMVTAN